MSKKSIASQMSDKPLSTLEAIFNPQSIAVIGAKESEHSVGRTLFLNLTKDGFLGSVFPVNPNHTTLFGQVCYPSIKDVPEYIDLAIIVVPAARVPKVLEECAEKEVKGAIIISAGFKEAGPEGRALEEKILSIAKESGIRLLGPNCLGILIPRFSLNASFAKSMPKNGSIAFLSQSGALCTAVLDWSLKENIGFSSFVSVGSMTDIDWGDLIKYFGQDSETKSILMYVETVGDARSFFEKARRVAKNKPIIVIKPGKSNEAQHAANSHTGALSGSDAAFDAACERVGILRVQTIEDLFSMAGLVSEQPLPKGPRLAIITNAGGPSVLATDAVVLQGGKVAQLETKTIGALSQFLPQAWSRGNPIDLLGDASPERYKKAAEAVLDDPNVDGVLFILTPQDMTDPKGTAEALISLSKKTKKTLLASWMGGETVQQGHDLLTKHGIPSFSYPDEAAKAFALMWKYAHVIEALYETPKNGISSLEDELVRQKNVRKVLNKFLKENKTLLSESESKSILKQWGFSVVESIKATSKEEAIHIADRIGYPVVLKLESNEIAHKASMGGVKLSLQSSNEVELAFDSIYENTISKYSKEAFKGVSVQKMVPHAGLEMIIGSSTDPQFGPLVLFGSGGGMVELFQDVSLALPPLNSVLASRLIQKTKVSKKLDHPEAFEHLLVQFSDFVTSFPEIVECDLNPVLETKTGALILDARIVLGKSPYVPAAIRPYPLQYVERKIGKDGTELLFRSIRSEDESLLVNFHKELTKEAVYQGYLRERTLEERTSHERLSRICFADPDKDIIILGEYEKNGAKKIAGVVRLTRIDWTQVWDLMFILKDEFATYDVLELFLQKMFDIAQVEGVSTISASVLTNDEIRLSLLQQYGFSEYGHYGPIIRLLKLL